MLPLNGPPVRAILLDIEGTTTRVDFVYRTLLPHARKRMREFLSRHWEDPAVRADIEALRRQQKLDPGFQPPWLDDSREAQLASALDYAIWLMDRDRKSTPLKSLQGKIWQVGYRSGELRGEVFPDVPRAFARWSRQGKAICIFSSGSVLAQQLLFATTTSGDLTSFIQSYFDTAVGAKTEAESYKRIAASISSPAPEILFVSDVTLELDAARLAGMETALCVRPEGSETTASIHPMIHTFDEIFP